MFSGISSSVSAVNRDNCVIEMEPRSMRSLWAWCDQVSWCNENTMPEFNRRWQTAERVQTYLNSLESNQATAGFAAGLQSWCAETAGTVKFEERLKTVLYIKDNFVGRFFGNHQEEKKIVTDFLENLQKWCAEKAGAPEFGKRLEIAQKVEQNVIRLDIIPIRTILEKWCNEKSGEQEFERRLEAAQRCTEVVCRSGTWKISDLELSSTPIDELKRWDPCLKTS